MTINKQEPLPTTRLRPVETRVSLGNVIKGRGGLGSESAAPASKCGKERRAVNTGERWKKQEYETSKKGQGSGLGKKALVQICNSEKTLVKRSEKMLPIFELNTSNRSTRAETVTR